MIPEKWNKENYKKFVNYLHTLSDNKYKEFHSSLVLNSKYEMIGIRVPIMKNIAKQIAKESKIEDFLNIAQDNYYEEIMIQGLVISYIKDESIFNSYFKKHIRKIDNWALCDTFCSSLKIVEKYEDKYFKVATKMSLCKEEFVSRIGLVLILSYFINEENIKTIFEILNKIESNLFYINMAEAWLVCELYIKFPKDTLLFIKENNLNKFTQNKAISKINDSFRISQEEKLLLSKYRK